MNTKNLKMRIGLAAVVLVGVGLFGCSGEPAATPIDQRKPGQDISPQDRSEKRGDVPDPEKPTAGAAAGTAAPGGK